MEQAKRLGRLIPHPGHVQLRGWGGRLGGSRSLKTELPDGWVTLSGEGQKSKKNRVVLTYGTAVGTLRPCLYFSTDVGKTETSEKDRNWGTQWLAGITIPYDCVQPVQAEESAVCLT